jgi:nitroreductase
MTFEQTSDGKALKEFRKWSREYRPTYTPWQITEQEFPANGNNEDKMRYLLRYAILAPSTHNTQPWKFRIQGHDYYLSVDPTRWLTVSDADKRELYVSAGCVLENLLIALEHFGFGHLTVYFPDEGNPDLVVKVTVLPEPNAATSRARELFHVIPFRHTNHRAYNGRAVHSAERQALEACYASECAEGIDLFLTSNVDIKRRVNELSIQADVLQFASPRFRDELSYCLGEGSFTASWLIDKLARLATHHLNVEKGIAPRDSELLLSAPLVGVITTGENDRRSQVLAGQVFERVFLTATMLGLSLQPVTQILQVSELKAELAQQVPLPLINAQMVFRLGYAEESKEPAPRRPLEEMVY